MERCGADHPRQRPPSPRKASSFRPILSPARIPREHQVHDSSPDDTGRSPERPEAGFPPDTATRNVAGRTDDEIHNGSRSRRPSGSVTGSRHRDPRSSRGSADDASLVQLTANESGDFLSIVGAK